LKRSVATKSVPYSIFQKRWSAKPAGNLLIHPEKEEKNFIIVYRNLISKLNKKY